MEKSSFYIVGKHTVLEALKNPRRKVLRVFLTEDSKKQIHKENSHLNLLKNIKIFYKTKKELDKYCSNEKITHQGFVAEIEHLEEFTVKNFLAPSPSTIICLPSICIWVVFGSSIKLIIKNTKIKKNIEYLLALLLVVTAVIIVIY